MKQVTVDAVLREKLNDLKEPLKICDEKGQVLAWVAPAYDPSRYGPLEPQISEAELQEREKSDDWCTTEEVLAHLKHLENS